MVSVYIEIITIHLECLVVSYTGCQITNPMKKKSNYIYAGIGLIAIILFYILDPYFSEKKRNKENIEYPLIYGSHLKFEGIIVKRNISMSWKGTYLFTLSNNQKFSGEHISFLQIGDSIFKAANSDSLYIFNEEGKSVISVKKYN